MTAPLKTQCPSCHLCFNIPSALLKVLDQASTEVRCGNCQHVFLVNDHLVVSADNVPAQSSTNLQQLKTASTSRKPLNDSLLANENRNPPEFNPFDQMTSNTSLALDTTPQKPSKSSATTQSYSDSPAASDDSNNINHATSHIDSHPISPNDSFLYEHFNKHTTYQVDDSSLSSNTSSNHWLEDLLKEQNARTENNESTIEAIDRLSSSNFAEQSHLTQHHLQQQSLNRFKPRLSPTLMLTDLAVDSVLWAIGCIVLVLLLFAQYVIFNLNTLMKNPVYAERLQAVCAVAICSLPLADIEAFSVSKPLHRASRLKTADKFSDIQANLLNQSQQTQILPNLKVTIYQDERVIGEFIALPEDYLLSYQSEIAADYSKPFMFTIPIVNNKISKVIIDPIY